MLPPVPGLFDFRTPKTDKNNFAPRFGFAYAPKFDSGFLNKVFGEAGRSSFRGGFGMAYDVNFQNLITNRAPATAADPADTFTQLCDDECAFLVREQHGLPGRGRTASGQRAAHDAE